jgi:uncharacterized protein YbcI
VHLPRHRSDIVTGIASEFAQSLAPSVDGRPESGHHAATAPDGRLLAAISNAIVRLHKELYGRGPTKARTIYQDDLVICLLEGGYSKAEQTLHERGRDHVVTQQRAEFQAAVKDDFTRAVEELVGRPVSAFMSANHQSPDVMCEVFMLEGPRKAASAGSQESATGR